MRLPRSSNLAPVVTEELFALQAVTAFNASTVWCSDPSMLPGVGAWQQRSERSYRGSTPPWTVTDRVDGVIHEYHGEKSWKGKSWSVEISIRRLEQLPCFDVVRSIWESSNFDPELFHIVSVQVHGSVDRTDETSSCGYQESEQRISQSPSAKCPAYKCWPSAYVPCFLQDLCFCTSWACRMLASQRSPLLIFLLLLFLAQYSVLSSVVVQGHLEMTGREWLG